MVYKIRILVVGPSSWITIDSELSLCGVFLHVAARLGSREKSTAAKHGFARSAPQKAVVILEARSWLARHWWTMVSLFLETL